MTAPKKPKKRKSGAQYRKERKIREQAAHEARVALLKAQGKQLDIKKLDEIPKWEPRPHQEQLEEAYQKGIKRQAHVWHRRAGKSAACLDFMFRRAIERPGNYWFMTPKLTQTRTAIWNSRRADGYKEIDIHIPADHRSRMQDNHMSIELINGSRLTFTGSDGFDKLVGSNVHGLIFDEFALGDPAAWDYLSPILAADPESWAVFISTYRGKNHWYRMVDRAKDNEMWHTSILTIEDTTNGEGQPIVTREIIEQERAEGKQEGYIQQEYYCSPMAAFEGAYYAGPMRDMVAEKRIGCFAYEPALPVTCSVDLGYADELVFIFWQTKGNEERVIGSISWKFTELAVALDDVRHTFPWGKKSMTFILPHDGRFGTADLFEQHGHEVVVLPKSGSVAREIQQVQGFLGRMKIDNEVREWTENEDNNGRLIEALLGYRTAKSHSDSGVYQKAPAHTWESHWADAVRYYVNHRVDNEQTTGWGQAPDYSQTDRIARTLI